MNGTWRSDITPAPVPIGFVGVLRIALRGPVLVLLLLCGLALLLALRLIERPLFRTRRPLSPAITVVVCRTALLTLGIRYRVSGAPMPQMGAMVANHSTWLDIFALNARAPVYFVAKSEVARWPGIGWLARATGTVFIRRRGRDARLHRDVFETRLRAGHRLLFFPEGTSTDGSLVLRFKSTLFEAFFAQDMPPLLSIQPVSVSYAEPPGAPVGFYGWWGDMEMGSHLLQVLAAPSRGCVRLTYHPPMRVADFADRKQLALACEKAVRAGVVA